MKKNIIVRIIMCVIVIAQAIAICALISENRHQAQKWMKFEEASANLIELMAEDIDYGCNDFDNAIVDTEEYKAYIETRWEAYK